MYKRQFINCLLVLNLVDKSTDVRKKLNGELIASLDEFLWVLSGANTRRSTGQDDSTSGQSGALGKEADQLGDTEDQITAEDVKLASSSRSLLSRNRNPVEDSRQGAVLHHTAALETTDLQFADIGDQSSGGENGA